jgi:hypothetical protein
MTKFLTQPEQAPAPRKGKKQPAQPTQATAPAITLHFDGDIGGIEVALDRLAGVVSSYVTRATRGENMYELYTAEGTSPVKVHLEGCEASEALHHIAATLDHLEPIAIASERIATAFERIATVLEGRPAR